MPGRPALLLAALVAVLPVACDAPASDVAGPTAPAASPTATSHPGPARSVAAPVPTARTADDREVAAFTDPEVLTGALGAAERAIRDPSAPVEDLRRPAWVQQQAYRDLVEQPGWVDQVRAGMPPELRDAFDANLRAGAELRRLTRPREELPDWTIVPPPPADELLADYEAAQAEFGVHWSYLAAIHLVETRMGRIRGDSIAGARGPMQFLPSTWAAYGEGDILDVRDAIRAAARYLVAHGAPGDMDGALWAYNHSDRYVAAVQAHAGVMRAEPETFRGYYHWRVYYRLSTGDVVLDEGWSRDG